jgi:hypothetical protein
MYFLIKKALSIYTEGFFYLLGQVVNSIFFIHY